MPSYHEIYVEAAMDLMKSRSPLTVRSIWLRAEQILKEGSSFTSHISWSDFFDACSGSRGLLSEDPLPRVQNHTASLSEEGGMAVGISRPSTNSAYLNRILTFAEERLNSGFTEFSSENFLGRVSLNLFRDVSTELPFFELEIENPEEQEPLVQHLSPGKFQVYLEGSSLRFSKLFEEAHKE